MGERTRTMKYAMTETTLTAKQIDNRMKKIQMLDREMKKLAEAQDALKDEIKSFLGDREEYETDNFRISYRWEVAHGLDTTALKKEHADLWELFPKNTHRRPFKYSTK